MRVHPLLVTLALLAAPLAGCVGAEDPDGGDTGGGDPPAENVAPVARFTVDPATGGAETTFTFDASGSTDANGDTLKYEWLIGSSVKKTGAKATHKFGFTDATIPVRLTVTDSEGLTSTATKALKLGTGINRSPLPSVFVDPQWVKPGETVSFDATATSDPDGDEVQVAFGWRRADGASVAVDSGEILANGRWTHTYTEEGTYLLHCHPHPFMKHNVTVSASAPAQANVQVSIEKFRYVPEDITIRPGTVVTYLNKDQVMHTVTLEKFGRPITPIPASGLTGTVTFEADGVYEIVATAVDSKEAVGEGTARVLVDSSKPDDVYTNSWTGKINATLAAGTPLDETKRHSFKIDHPGKGTVNLTFTSSVPDTQMRVAVEPSDGGAGGAETTGASPLSLAVDLRPGVWTVVVSAERAVAVDYTADVRLQLELVPVFEEESGGHEHGGHDH